MKDLQTMEDFELAELAEKMNDSIIYDDLWNHFKNVISELIIRFRDKLVHNNF